MSVSSSTLSTHSSPPSWQLNDRLVSLMESIYAIIAGLGLRFVVDTVSRHDFKITGTLVGLWEGVILLHFLKKLPKSTDPYLAFAVRLFIDFVVTESVSRMVLVLTWTGMGMILADVAPAIWEDAGLRRIWRRFRRDLYIISESVPTVVFFPPTRTVRFSPSREPSVIAEAEEEEEGEPDADAHTEARSVESSTSADLTEQDISASIEPTSIRRRLPGYFPGALSDTESVMSSVASRSIRLPSTFQPERTSRRLSVYPINTADDDFASETSSQRNEVEDDTKLSSSTSSQSTVTGPADTTRFTDDIRITEDFDTTQITEIPDEEVLIEQKPAEIMERAEQTVKKNHRPEVETALKPPNFTPFLPPTPSDSQPTRKRRLPREDHARPPSASIPQIPDMPEDLPSDGHSDEWENIQKEDANDAEVLWEQVLREDAVGADQPPPPPPKDWLGTKLPLATTSTNTNDRANEETTNIDAHRYSEPPPYVDHLDEHDDIYEDHPSGTGAVAGDSSHLGLGDSLTLGDGQQIDEKAVDKQREAEEIEKKRLEQEVVVRKRQEEAAEKRREEEAEKKRLEDETAAAQKRKEEEEAAEKRRLEEEKRKEAEAMEMERKRLEEEVAAERKRKEEEVAEMERRRLEEEAAERKRKEEEAAKMERRRLEEEEAEWKRKAAEMERKRFEEEAAEWKRKEEEAAEMETRRLEEEVAAERKRKEEEEAAEMERRRLEEAEAAERKRKEEEAAEMERRRLEEEEAEWKRKAAEMERRRFEEEAAERKRKEEEAAEMERRRLEEEAAEMERKRLEKAAEAAEMERRRLEEEEEAERKHKEEQAAEKERKRLEDEAETQLPQQTGTAPSALAETQGADEQQSSETVKEVAQTNVQLGTDEPDSEEQHRMETESVATEQSTIPSDVESRLSHILLTKAQRVEIQSQIGELEGQLVGAGEDARHVVENELQRALKVLEKLKKKEQRRRDDAIAHPKERGLNDREDFIALDALGPDVVKTRLLEKLEELLSPEATSLRLTVECGTRKSGGGKPQKQAVTEVLQTFNLFNKVNINERQFIVYVSAELFSEWVTEYRSSVTQLDVMDV